ncbi:MAG: flagellar hook-basal body complex protein [Magnetospirillum sp.]|nr:flagellar hook-basal body complex protein [Magnetospirillum sp.]
MIYGAFTNASQAMQSMDWAMGSISQNIANVNTTGYKEKDTQFKTVLSESHAAPAQSNNSPTQATATSGLDIFGVRAVDRNLITKSGTITTSTVWSDLAINGRGFFVVAPADSSGAPSTGSSGNLYTRAGNFQQKALNGNNYFVTAGGQYLMGWKADAQGNIGGVHTTAGSPVSSATSTATTATPALTPVYANIGQSITGVATTAMQMVANLPSNATQTVSPQSFTDTSTVTDGFGTAQTLTMQWTRASGDTWTVDFSLPPNPADGSVGTITGTPLTVTMDANGKITSPSTSASGIGYQDLTIDWSAGPTLQTTPSINLNANQPTFNTIAESLTIYDTAYNAHTLPVSFEHSGNGQWFMRFQPNAADATMSGLTATTAGVTTAYGNSIPITFNGDGSLSSPDSIAFKATWTAAGAGSNSVTIDTKKLTQFASTSGKKLDIKVIDQDGYAGGVMDGVDIANTGEVIAHFNNGRTRTLYMIPVATFVSADQLDPISGTMFRATEQAGTMSIDSITKQGSGAAIQSAAVESSNVDLADQFTKMIVTQKAYSVNANVFKTADEMTQSVRDLIT